MQTTGSVRSPFAVGEVLFERVVNGNSLRVWYLITEHGERKIYAYRYYIPTQQQGGCSNHQ